MWDKEKGGGCGGKEQWHQMKIKYNDNRQKNYVLFFWEKRKPEEKAKGIQRQYVHFSKS